MSMVMAIIIYTLFSPVGCGVSIWCAKMACIVTIIIQPYEHKSSPLKKKTLKKLIQAKFFSNAPTLIFLQ